MYLKGRVKKIFLNLHLFKFHQKEKESATSTTNNIHLLLQFLIF